MKGEKNSYRNVNDKDRNVKDLHPDRKLLDIGKIFFVRIHDE